MADRSEWVEYCPVVSSSQVSNDLFYALNPPLLTSIYCYGKVPPLGGDDCDSQRSSSAQAPNRITGPDPVILWKSWDFTGGIKIESSNMRTDSLQQYVRLQRALTEERASLETRINQINQALG